MANNMFKKLLKLPFRMAGFDIVKQPGRKDKDDTTGDVYSDPVTALYHRPVSDRDATAFHCSIGRCVNEFGFGFGPGEWHPFVAALRQMERDRHLTYSDSVLKTYYDSWQPNNAAEALLGTAADSAETDLQSAEPFAYVVPWNEKTLDERHREVLEYMESENRDAGFDEITAGEGFNHFGPVSARKGKIELHRLQTVQESIGSAGYSRSSGWDGDIRGYIIRRKDDYRYVVLGGHHRLAALAALEYESVPVRIDFPVVVQAQDAACWPQVVKGTWTKECAVRYFHHLFDFDSREWAERMELWIG